MAITTFIPELWNARLLYALEKNHVATNVVNRNYEGEIKNAGDTVHINTLGAVAVRSYAQGTDLTYDALSTTDQTLVIDQQKYFAFALDDVDKAQAAGDIMDVAMGRAAYSLADVSDAFLLGKIAAGGSSDNYVGSSASPVALTAANIYTSIVALRTALDKQNVPTQGRSLVVPPEAYALLLQDARFTSVQGVADGVIQNGLVGKVAGFDIYMSNNCVKTSADTPVYSITAQIADATTYAEQIIQTEALRPEASFSDAVRGLHVYGAKVTRPEAIATLFGTF
jgi:hypothetical protein